MKLTDKSNATWEIPWDVSIDVILSWKCLAVIVSDVILDLGSPALDRISTNDCVLSVSPRRR